HDHGHAAGDLAVVHQLLQGRRDRREFLGREPDQLGLGRLQVVAAGGKKVNQNDKRYKEDNPAHGGSWKGYGDIVHPRPYWMRRRAPCPRKIGIVSAGRSLPCPRTDRWSSRLPLAVRRKLGPVQGFAHFSESCVLYNNSNFSGELLWPRNATPPRT